MNRPADQDQAVLDAIRQAEVEASRRLAAERELATEQLEAARRAADARIGRAEAAGRIEGENRRQAAGVLAKHNAADSTARAQKQAEALMLAGQAAMPAAVSMAMRFVLDGDHAP